MRLIDVDKLPKQYEFSKIKELADCLGISKKKFSVGVMAVWDAINKAPTIDPVKHGKLLICSDGYELICNECDSKLNTNQIYNYCPICGMKVESRIRWNVR